MARYPKSDPRSKYSYKFHNGDKVLVPVTIRDGKTEVRSGIVRRQFLPLAECRPEIVGTSLDGSRDETLVPLLPGPNDHKLRYAVSVPGFRMFEVFEDDLSPDKTHAPRSKP